MVMVQVGALASSVALGAFKNPAKSLVNNQDLATEQTLLTVDTSIYGLMG
jgi:hypothetical protein